MPGAPPSDPKAEGSEIEPEPCFVVKTRDIQTDRKVFINVATHAKVIEPRTVRRLNQAGEEVEGLSVPVAVGAVRIGGKGGGDSMTFDCVVNKTVVDEINKDESGQYRDFICQLVMEYVEQKSAKPTSEGGMGDKGVKVDKRYKLPKMKYHAWVGEDGVVLSADDLKSGKKKQQVSKQWVRDAGKGVKGISEVKSSKDDVKRHETNKANSTKKNAAPKVPMSSKKISAKVFTVESGGGLKSVSEYEDRQVSELPKPNPDKIDTSQLLTEPFLHNPPASVDLVRVVLKLPRDSGPNATVDCSAFLLSVLAPGFIKTEIILPYPVEWKKSRAMYDAGAQELCVDVPVLRDDIDECCDVGTKAWNLKEALSTGDKKPSKSSAAEEKEHKAGEGMAEDKFHLNMPKGYNMYSGQYQDGDVEDDGNDTGELPEDRFHQQDIISQHILQQQADERKNKIEKADKERQERRKKKEEGGIDDGMEYLDVDDFKPGGKYFSGQVGNPNEEPGNIDASSRLINKDLTKAADVMKEMVSEASSTASKTSKLSSSLWTELLD